MLLHHLQGDCIEIGCDEAGRGCLAGDVYAAAVVLPEGFELKGLNDSKQVSERKREALRETIEREATAWAVGVTTVQEIDRINILNASILAMHRAIDGVVERLRLMGLAPGHIIVDGNRFKPYGDVPYSTVVKGDGRFMSIAAASILAKTHRDEYMRRLDEEYPMYDWAVNKGYPTAVHRRAIAEYGATEYHRRSFRLLDSQLELEF